MSPLDPRLWLALGAISSSYLLTMSLVGTIAVKLIALSSIKGRGSHLIARLAVCAPDTALLSALAALLVAGEQLGAERGSATLKWAVRALALIVAVFSLLNGAYLSLTGDQLTAGIILMGWQRLHDAYGILLEELRRHRVPLGAGLGLFVVLPWLARRALNTSSKASSTPRPAAPLAVLSLCAGVLWLVIPASSSLPMARLARSAILTTYSTWIMSSMQAMPESEDGIGLDLGPLVEPGSKQNPASRFNVVIVMVESLRHDYTSLSHESRMQTPHIAALAKRGAFSDSASTPVPHTTKALFAVHCGHLPLWQSDLPELGSQVRAQCLGQVLQAAGYDTAFFQSAVGAFEDRPRMANRMGFSRFEAWENIGGEPLGYLASDDLSLAGAFDRFLSGRSGDRPFLATLLTSATHHPYRLPQGALDRVRAEGLDVSTLSAETRYGMLAKRADELIGKVVETIDRRGLTDRTLIVVLGDHGEGFGDKGVRQHDNNYYEESLRVPLLFAGPGVEPHELLDVSLVDVTPTLLGLLGFDAVQRDDDQYGRNALAKQHAARTQYFSCFYDGVCFGSVSHNQKIVVLPEFGRVMRFDLNKDPTEEHELSVKPDAPELARLSQLARRLHVSGGGDVSDLRLENGWVCPKGGYCRHPKTPPSLFFTPAIPNECVKVKPNAVSNAQGFAHMLSLHNVCSGSTVCELSVGDEDGEKTTVKLRPDEARELVMQREAPRGDFKYRIDCQFL